MYLSKIEIFGFKSFPEKTKIDFDSGVSAIVGPNGSGKSNIVDAIRWVLGEQGDKILRSEKREDIVFNGSKNRKPLSVAEVSITIQNNKNILPTEYSEVQIARRFFRSGETEYYLNGTKVRLKDIRNLFLDTGIGPDAYSVIELKMIETILSPLKTERRKMFEEAAGIVSYKVNRDLTYKRLEAVKESLIRVNDIIREKQRNVTALERQAKKNEEAKIVYEELKLLEIKVALYDYTTLNNEITYIRNSESDNILLKERLEKEITDYDTKSDILRKDYHDYESKIESINEDVNKKRDRINEIEKSNLVTEQKIKSKEENIQRLNTDILNLKENIEKGKVKEESIRANLKVIKETLEISEKSLTEKKQSLSETVSVINEKKNEIINLGTKLKQTTKGVNSLKSEYQKYKVKFDNNLERLNRISKNTESSLLQIKDLETKKEIIEKDISDKNAEKSRLSDELDSKSSDKQNLLKELKALETDLGGKNAEVHNLKNKISYLKNLLDSFEDYAEGIQYLLKEKNIKDLSTVINAIEVEDRYKLAIETALGEISNYLIIEDSSKLNKYIEQLIESKKGKVTFILNDKLPQNISFGIFYDYEPDFTGEKGVIGFADRYIKCKNPAYESLLRYLLDEYIIVENKTVAYKLAKDNYYKFITLEGDIITNSVIRAGGNLNEDTVKIGRERQIEKLQNTLKDLEKETDKLKNEQKALREKADKIETGFLEHKIAETEETIDSGQNEVSLINFKIEELNKTVTSNDTLYNKLKGENETYSSEINRLIEQINKSENEESNLEKEMDFLTEEFGTIEEKYTNDLSDYNAFNLEVLKIRNELKNEESNLVRTTNTIEIQNSQIEKNQNIIVKDTNQLEEYNRKIQQNNESLNDYNSQLGILISNYNTIKEKFDNLKSQVNEIEQGQRDRRGKFDKVSQRLIDSRVKIRENEIKSEQAAEYILKKYEINLLEADEDLKNLLPPSDIEEFDIMKAKTEVDELSERLKKLGGGYQQLVWDDYQTEKEELQKLVEQKNDLIESEKDIRKTIEHINKEARERFLKTFEEIRKNFINIFSQLFQEGDEANLKLIYEQEETEDGLIKTIEDPLEAKIEITAKPRGKKPTSIELLSTGEKALTAIALLFAIYLVKPSPFCILDEVDAPLDASNLGRFNKLIRRFSENTQFVLITHNERTMEKVDRLYGVTMQEPGVTTIVETKFKTAV